MPRAAIEHGGQRCCGGGHRAAGGGARHRLPSPRTLIHHLGAGACRHPQRCAVLCGRSHVRAGYRSSAILGKIRPIRCPGGARHSIASGSMKSLIALIAVFFRAGCFERRDGTRRAGEPHHPHVREVPERTLGHPSAEPGRGRHQHRDVAFRLFRGALGSTCHVWRRPGRFRLRLDAECKNNPNETLSDALTKIKPSDKNPMDLSTLDCSTFSNRHVELARTDRESADTIMMWLFGFATGKSEVTSSSRMA